MLLVASAVALAGEAQKPRAYAGLVFAAVFARERYFGSAVEMRSTCPSFSGKWIAVDACVMHLPAP